MSHETKYQSLIRAFTQLDAAERAKLKDPLEDETISSLGPKIFRETYDRLSETIPENELEEMSPALLHLAFMQAERRLLSPSRLGPLLFPVQQLPEGAVPFYYANDAAEDEDES